MEHHPVEMIKDWPAKAACKDRDPDTMFGSNANQKIEKKLCNHCPVKLECLADALDNKIDIGVWGGMTARERRALLRRHPHISSWREFFISAIKKGRT